MRLRTKANLPAYLLTLFLLFSGVMTTYAQNSLDLDNRVRFSGTHITLGKAMGEIEAQSGYTFAFNMTQLETGAPVKFTASEMTIREALSQMFSGGKFNVVVRTRFIAVSPDQSHAGRANAAARARDNRPLTADVYQPTDPASLSPASISRGQTEPEYEIERVISYFPADRAVRNYPTSYSAYEAAGSYAKLYSSLPRTAIKTNLLYGAGLLTPNLSLEIGTRPRQTFEFSGSYSWRGRTDAPSDHHKQFAHWVLRLEYRWWTCERFNGLYYGIHALYSRYYVSGKNIPLLFDKDYSYDGHAVCAGATIGFNLPIGKRWGLEFNVGVGYAYMWYDKGNCVTCDPLLEKDTKHYFGPTRAGINLIFILK